MRARGIPYRFRRGRLALGLGLLCLAGWNASGMGVRAEAPTRKAPNDIAALKIEVKDIEAAIHVTKYEPKEAEKIGRDFMTAYRFRHLSFRYKQPNKIRLEAKSPTLGNPVLILNGAMRFYTIPKLNIKNKENLEGAPGKRQSLLEYGGLLSPETLLFMQGRFVREETLEGETAWVYDLTYQGEEGGSYFRVWFDPRTRITRKREWLNAENQLRATFLYQEPVEAAPDVWLPSRVEIKNAEGVTATSLTLDDMKVNQGLPDTLFTIAP